MKRPVHISVYGVHLSLPPITDLYRENLYTPGI
jgi:hypothetical protein